MVSWFRSLVSTIILSHFQTVYLFVIRNIFFFYLFHIQKHFYIVLNLAYPTPFLNSFDTLILFSVLMNMKDFTEKIALFK